MIRQFVNERVRDVLFDLEVTFGFGGGGFADIGLVGNSGGRFSPDGQPTAIARYYVIELD